MNESNTPGLSAARREELDNQNRVEALRLACANTKNFTTAAEAVVDAQKYYDFLSGK